MTGFISSPIADDANVARWVLVFTAAAYSFVLMVAHIVYLDVYWGYYGFKLHSLTPLEIIVILIATVGVAAVLPVWLNKPSAVILMTLFLFVYVPTLVITPGLTEGSFTSHAWVLAALIAVFFLAGLASMASCPNVGNGVPGKRSIAIAFIAWLLLAIVLIYTYSGILRFVGVADLYDQRAAGAATNIWIGYAQTYFVLVLSPFLLTIGLLRKHVLFVIFGISGFLLMYLINAQRIVFLIMVAIIAIHILVSSRYRLFSSTGFYIGSIAVLIALLLIQNLSNPLIREILALFVFRAIALPGLTLSQYDNIFTEYGYTWWSHVKGISSFIASPDIAQFPQWPSLGYIVGELEYGNAANNVNAHLFSSDGVAAAGPLGILIIGLVLILILHLLDRFARDWDPKLTTLMLFPFAFSLTNAPLFTSMLSFGGGFWLIAFLLWRPTPKISSQDKDGP